MINLKSKESKYHPIPEEMKEFNWAAFLLTFLWGFKYKAWITFLAIPLIIFQLPLNINWILLVALQLYCGKKGNEWAYQRDWWMKPIDFRINQMKWATGALVFFVIVPFCIITITSRFIKKDIYNPQSLIQNSLCINSYRELNRHAKDIEISNKATSNSMATDFAKTNKKFQKEANIVTVKNESDKFSLKNYNIYFHKYNSNVCLLNSKNCRISTQFNQSSDSDEQYRECVFFIDKLKTIHPDEQTQKYIDKGHNIFKYL